MRVTKFNSVKNKYSKLLANLNKIILTKKKKRTDNIHFVSDIQL